MRYLRFALDVLVIGLLAFVIGLAMTILLPALIIYIFLNNFKEWYP